MSKKRHNIHMIKKVLKSYRQLTKNYHLGVLASSITFYMLIVLVPLGVLLMQVLTSYDIIIHDGLQSALHNVGKNFLTTAILIINLLWSTSQALHALNMASDMIFTNTKKRSAFRLRISSFLLMFFLIGLLLVLLFVSNIGLTFVQIYTQGNFKIILSILEIVMNFIIVILLIAIIYKFIIPMKISFGKSVVQALYVTICWGLVTVLMQLILKIIQAANLNQIYEMLGSAFSYVYWLYTMCYIFLLSIIKSYYDLKNTKKEA